MSETVNHPAHYGGAENPHEPIKIIEHYKLGFCLGNAIKYLLRAGKKPGADTLEDLKKARWYLDREIARIEAGSLSAEDAAKRLRAAILSAPCIGNCATKHPNSPLCSACLQRQNLGM